MMTLRTALFFRTSLVFLSILLVSLLAVLVSATSTHAASTISETDYEVADLYAQYYPFYLDDQQNPGWTADGGSEDFTFAPYNKSYGSGSMHLEYEVFLENDDGDRLASGEQVKVGDVIHVVVPTPEPCRGWGWKSGIDTAGWEAKYDYDAVPPASLSTSGPGPVVTNDNSNQTAIIDDLANIRREDVTQSRFSYRGAWNGESFYLAMFVEDPTVSHAINGSASVTQLSETSYRVDTPGTLEIETTFAATDVKEYFAMEEVEIDRIMTIYEDLGYQTTDQYRLAYDRLQDLKSKVVDGVVVEEVVNTTGSTFTIETAVLTNELTVTAADNTNPPAPDVRVTNSAPIYPGDTVEFEITAPSASEPVVYKMDWNNDGTNDQIVGPPGPGVSFADGSTPLTVTRQWSADGVKTLAVRTYNESGYLSYWTPVSVTVAEKPPVTMSMEIFVSGRSWSTEDQTIDPTDELALRWDSQQADSCVGFNVNTNGLTTTIPGGVGIDAPNAGGSTTYRVECSDGVTVAVAEIDVSAPVSPELYAYLQPATRSEAFNYSTGSYDEYTVNFVLANDAPADEPSSIPYTVSLDIGANGSYDMTQSGSFSSGVGPDSQESRNVTFNDIPFGQMSVQVDINYPGLDALQTVVNVPPPEPDTTLDVTPIIIRTGTQALIEWDVGAEYPMDCTLRGGSLLTTFDPSVDGATGSTTSPALNSAMQYELRCIEVSTGTEFVEEFRVEVIGAPIQI